MAAEVPPPTAGGVTELEINESDVLGEGGSECKIYSGKATVDGMQYSSVAVKVFKPEWFTGSARTVAMAKRKKEREFLLQRSAVNQVDVDGGGICKVFGLFEHPEHNWCIVMRRYSGTLQEELAEREFDSRGPVGLPQILVWTLTLAEAIAQLHRCEQPLVYQDLKPQNVLVDDKLRVFLCDFGISRILDETGLTSTLKSTTSGGGGGGGGLAGTLFYKSPEQAGAKDEEERLRAQKLFWVIFISHCMILSTSASETKCPPPAHR